MIKYWAAQCRVLASWIDVERRWSWKEASSPLRGIHRRRSTTWHSATRTVSRFGRGWPFADWNVA
jgi:hypothetical protein